MPKTKGRGHKQEQKRLQHLEEGKTVRSLFLRVGLDHTAQLDKGEIYRLFLCIPSEPIRRKNFFSHSERALFARMHKTAKQAPRLIHTGINFFRIKKAHKQNAPQRARRNKNANDAQHKIASL